MANPSILQVADPSRLEEAAAFNHFMRQWIYVDRFVVSDKESMNQLKSIRFHSRYSQMIRAETCCAPDDQMTTALRPDSSFDRRDLALWLKHLLLLIRDKVR